LEKRRLCGDGGYGPRGDGVAFKGEREYPEETIMDRSRRGEEVKKGGSSLPGGGSGRRRVLRNNMAAARTPALGQRGGAKGEIFMGRKGESTGEPQEELKE